MGNQEKIMLNFQRSSFKVLKVLRDVASTILWRSREALFCMEFPDVKNLKIPGVLSKKYVPKQLNN